MADKPQFSVKVARTPAEIEACGKIRVEVFVDEQGFPVDTEFDDVDDQGTGVQFLVSADATSESGPIPVGVVRLVPAKGKLTRLAVLKAYRSYGLGRVLVNALEEYVVANANTPALADVVREVGGKRVAHVKIHSQLPVVKFYAKLGYIVVGDEFDEEGEPHLLMEKDLPLEA